MSSKLVKKSLELFESDFVPTSEPVKKKKKKKDQDLETTSYDPLSLISTKKKGVKKELQRLKMEQLSKQKKKAQRSSVEEFLHNQPKDLTEASVSSLCRLSSVSKVEDKATTTIVNHHLTKLRKEPIKRKEPKKKNEPQQSAFTDEDFEKFFLEYNDPLNKS